MLVALLIVLNLAVTALDAWDTPWGWGVTLRLNTGIPARNHTVCAWGNTISYKTVISRSLPGEVHATLDILGRGEARGVINVRVYNMSLKGGMIRYTVSGDDLDAWMTLKPASNTSVNLQLLEGFLRVLVRTGNPTIKMEDGRVYISMHAWNLAGAQVLLEDLERVEAIVYRNGTASIKMTYKGDALGKMKSLIASRTSGTLLAILSEAISGDARICMKGYRDNLEITIENAPEDGVEGRIATILYRLHESRLLDRHVSIRINGENADLNKLLDELAVNKVLPEPGVRVSRVQPTTLAVLIGILLSVIALLLYNVARRV